MLIHPMRAVSPVKQHNPLLDQASICWAEFNHRQLRLRGGILEALESLCAPNCLFSPIPILLPHQIF